MPPVLGSPNPPIGIILNKVPGLLAALTAVRLNGERKSA
jgi:hypothetical protein